MIEIPQFRTYSQAFQWALGYVFTFLLGMGAISIFLARPVGAGLVETNWLGLGLGLLATWLLAEINDKGSSSNSLMSEWVMGMISSIPLTFIFCLVLTVAAFVVPLLFGILDLLLFCIK